MQANITRDGSSYRISESRKPRASKRWQASAHSPSPLKVISPDGTVKYYKVTKERTTRKASAPKMSAAERRQFIEDAKYNRRKAV